MSISSSQPTVVAPVGTAATSKVNWTGLAMIVIPPLVAQAGGRIFGLTSEQLLNLITALTPVIGALTVYFRTFRTTAILPQSLPK